MSETLNFPSEFKCWHSELEEWYGEQKERQDREEEAEEEAAAASIEGNYDDAFFSSTSENSKETTSWTTTTTVTVPPCSWKNTFSSVQEDDGSTLRDEPKIQQLEAHNANCSQQVYRYQKTQATLRFPNNQQQVESVPKDSNQQEEIMQQQQQSSHLRESDHQGNGVFQYSSLIQNIFSVSSPHLVQPLEANKESPSVSPTTTINRDLNTMVHFAFQQAMCDHQASKRQEHPSLDVHKKTAAAIPLGFPGELVANIFAAVALAAQTTASKAVPSKTTKPAPASKKSKPVPSKRQQINKLKVPKKQSKKDTSKPIVTSNATTSSSRMWDDSDRPTRPRSAFNYFFQHERARMLQESKTAQAAESAAAAVSEQQATPPKGKVGFAFMGREISKNWKAIDKETRANFQKIANVDMKRYVQEKEAYLTRKRKREEDEKQLHVET